MIVEFAYKSDAEFFMEEIVKVSSMKPKLDTIDDVNRPKGMIMRWEVWILKTDITKAFAQGFIAVLSRGGLNGHPIVRFRQ